MTKTATRHLPPFIKASFSRLASLNMRQCCHAPYNVVQTDRRMEGDGRGGRIVISLNGRAEDTRLRRQITSGRGIYRESEGL
jgi:hypothetical protein